MDLNKLHDILRETTCQLRKGEEVEKRQEIGLDITEIYAMPHEAEARPDLEKVDCEFVVIGVDKAKADEHRAEFIELLNSYPNPERLAGGPSYIEVGAEIGDQGAAFQLFALGQVLGLWSVITPASMGITGPEARQLAGSGFVMMSGYRAAASK
jgi:hypothetical protein